MTHRELKDLFLLETGFEWYDDFGCYIQWLEDKLIELQSQPSTTTPSDDVAAGHGAC